jgi:hypothetical protein
MSLDKPIIDQFSNIIIAHDIVQTKNLLTEYPELLEYHRFHLDRSILHFMIEENFLEGIQFLLELSPGLTLRADRNGITPALLAAMSGDIRVLSTLLQHQPDLINDTGLRGDTIAHYAVFVNSPKCLSYLLSLKPELLYMRDQNERTLAHAALSGVAVSVGADAGCLKIILEKAPEMALAQNSDGQTPLYCSVVDHFDNKNKEGFLYLLNCNPSALYVQDIKGMTPLHRAARIDNLTCLAHILRQDSSLSFLSLTDKSSRKASEYSAPGGCRILLAWYDQSVYHQAPRYMDDFIKSIKNKSALPTRAADEIIDFYHPLWPEDLKNFVVLSASPKKAQEILSSV